MGYYNTLCEVLCKAFVGVDARVRRSVVFSSRHTLPLQSEYPKESVYNDNSGNDEGRSGDMGFWFRISVFYLRAFRVEGCPGSSPGL